MADIQVKSIRFRCLVIGTEKQEAADFIENACEMFKTSPAKPERAEARVRDAAHRNKRKHTAAQGTQAHAQK